VTDVRRREFITLLGGAAVAWPLAARAQQSAMPVIGFIDPLSLETTREKVAAFNRGLAEAGYIEGRNVAIEYRWAEGQNDRLPGLAADLIRRAVAVIATPGSTSATLAAKAATETIPIVFVAAGDPVDLGLVRSLKRPGGNLTGVSFLSTEVVAKRLELLHELVPAATLIAALVNPTNVVNAEVHKREIQDSARVLGVRSLILNASTLSDIEAAFATLVQERVGALMIGTDSFFTAQRDQIIALAARHAVPTIAGFREFTAAGGLMAYGSSIIDAWHLAGSYTGRILKGEKPSDLPVQQSTKVEFFLNLKTARALGLTVPIPLLGRADEVIE
jgi:putative tryptophan/tyrosine transport system substrate-binding protein